ncbi:hypothetical protein [Paenimyroides aestuarii]|uniref:Lipoprotein n=1 Tax=Paenimyroides aestuarii TaxID=2968490 RepID=A0ABY5NQC7_9FLAO|nr:hypothetical protein [Paenimyroides aestuarii]UUV20769.1 hypothetical protein NPX36_10625 [Paenimyroides aestuarii]
MRNVVYILIFGILIFLISCKQNDKKNEMYNENRELVPNPEGQIMDKVTVADNEIKCNFDKLLNDPKTPKLAQELFNNTAKYSEEPLLYFGKLKDKDKATREFYFRVLTNSYKISDGAYSEGLGNLGKEFIEDNPKDFALFFDNKVCFNETDLKVWAKIVLLEFEIIDENIETGKGKPLVNGYCKKLIKDSENYSESQKTTIKKFCNFLQNEWGDFLKHID